MVGISINLGSTYTSYARADTALKIRPRLADYTTLQFKWLVRWRGIGLEEVLVCMQVLQSGVRLKSQRCLAATAAQSWDTVPSRWCTNTGPLSWFHSFTLNNWPSAVPYTLEIQMIGGHLSLQFESTKFKRLFKVLTCLGTCRRGIGVFGTDFQFVCFRRSQFPNPMKVTKSKSSERAKQEPGCILTWVPLQPYSASERSRG